MDDPPATGFMGDPTTMGLLGLAGGFGQAAGASRLPVPLGAAFGSAAQGMMAGMTNAAKLRALAAAEQQHKDELALKRQEFGIKMQQFQQSQQLMQNLPAMFGQGGGMPQAQPDGGGMSPSTGAPSGGGGAPLPIADRMLPPHAQAFLQGVYGAESSGYNMRYGGSTFDNYADHPRTPVPVMGGPMRGQYSTAAGRPQFLAGTWDEIKNKYQLPDFSPANQDRGAWYLARDTYQKKTGRDLGADLQNPDPMVRSGITQALAGVWPSLPGGNQPNGASGGFWNRYDQALKGGNAAPQQPTAPAGNAIAGLPPQAQANIRARGDQMFQQASALQMMAASMAGNPHTAHIAPILQKRAEMMLQHNGWMPTTLANGLPGYVHAFSGEVKTIDQPRTVESWQNGRSTRMLDQPGVQSDAAPMKPELMMTPQGPRYVEPNSGAVRGAPMLDAAQIQVLPLQPGMGQPQTGMAPSPTGMPPMGAPAMATPPLLGPRAAQTPPGQPLNAADMAMAQATPNATTIGGMQRDQAASTTAGAEEGKRAEAVITGLSAIRDGRQNIALAKDALGQVSTGTFAPARMAAGNVAASLGINPFGVATDAAKLKNLDQIFAGSTLAKIAGNTSFHTAFSNTDMLFVKSQVGQISDPTLSNKIWADTQDALLRRAEDFGNGWLKAKQSGMSFSAYEAAYAKTRDQVPTFTPVTPADFAKAPPGVYSVREGDQWVPRVKYEGGAGGMPRVSSAADYEKIPSGAQYTDPSGNVRTKP